MPTTASHDLFVGLWTDDREEDPVSAEAISAGARRGCSACGNDLTLGDRFCSSCGGSVQATQAQTGSPVREAVAAEGALCPYCRFRLEGPGTGCPTCGAV